MPVDDLARIVLHLSRHTATSKIFHVVNSEALAWSDLVETIRRHGYPLRSLAYDDWLEEAKRAAISPEHGLYPILGLLPGPGEITPDGHDPYDTELRFDNRNTLAALLQGAQPVSPTIDRHVVRRWLTSLAERGFIPRPVSAPTLA